MPHRNWTTQNGDCVVLYLEDDDATAYIFQTAMQEAGAKLVLFRVTDGEEAISFLRREGVYNEAPRPVLVILDLNVPKKNGFEVLAAMEANARLKSIPAIVFSSSTRPEDHARAYTLGAHKFFVKPLEWNGFLQTAKEMCTLVAEAA